MGKAGAASSSRDASVRRFEPGAVEGERIVDTVPADQGRTQVRQQVSIHVQESDAEQPQHPLVRAGGHGVDAACLDVDGERAGLLNGVDHEEHAPVPAKATDGVHVGPVTACELHGADRDQPGPRSNRLLDRCGRHRPVHHRDFPHLDATVRQMLPRVDVGRILQGARHCHLVAGAPVQPFRHHRQAVGRALHERDLFGGGADELGGPRPDFRGARPPVGRCRVALCDMVVEPRVDRGSHPCRAGRNRRAVEIGAICAGRKRVAVLQAQGRHDGSSRSVGAHCMRRRCPARNRARPRFGRS